jgi:LL-diaminopimelate aminotransferase
MLKYSSLLQNIPDYPFAKVGKISRETEQKDGIKVINARIGIPDMEAPHAIKECLVKYIKEKNSTYGYPVDAHPARGIPELIDAIIDDYRLNYDVKIEPENIAVTEWTKGTLHNLVRLFQSPGKILIPDPVYQVYEAAALMSFNSVERVVASEATNWLPEFNLNAEDITAFYFCDPNNPTGAIADINYYKRLFKEMKKNNVCGIFDKAYRDFIFDDKTKPVSITQIPGLMDYGFEVFSLSKHFNYVGIGLGWIVSSKENIDLYLKISGYFSQGIEWYKQKSGVDALTNPEVRKEMDIYINELKKRRDLLCNGLNELGMKAVLPKATPYIWAKVPEGFNDEDFVLNYMIKKAHVAFMPGSYFGENGKGFFRTTLYMTLDQIDEVLNRIKKIRSW